MKNFFYGLAGLTGIVFFSGCLLIFIFNPERTSVPGSGPVDNIFYGAGCGVMIFMGIIVIDSFWFTIRKDEK